MRKIRSIPLFFLSLLFLSGVLTSGSPIDKPCVNTASTELPSCVEYRLWDTSVLVPLKASEPNVLTSLVYAPIQTSVASVARSESKYGYVKARELNLRSKPDRNSTILGQFKKYDELTILDNKGDWYRVSIGGMKGYMLCEYVSVGTPSKHSQSSSAQSASSNSDVLRSDESQTRSVQHTSYTVYITDTGSKYHRSGCRYLSKSKIAIDYSDALARGYNACSVCKP